MDARHAGGTCCCCCNLRTGVIILGVLTLMGGVSSVIISSINLSSSMQYCNSRYYYTDYCQINSFDIIAVTQGCMTIVVAGILLAGVSMGKPNMLVPYLVMMTINVIANVIIAVWLLIDWSYYAMGGYAIGILIGSCLACYFINVVRIYRLMMLTSIVNPFGTPGVAVVQGGPFVGAAYPGQVAYVNTGGYPQGGGAYPPVGGQYPPVGGQYPPVGGQYPPVGSQYPPVGGQYPPVGSQYPPVGGQYPPVGGQYPPPQQGANPPPPQGGYSSNQTVYNQMPENSGSKY